jgi:peptidoglycan/xylan/chitin deacetylase (PgdA/CDA1 family)
MSESKIFVSDSDQLNYYSSIEALKSNSELWDNFTRKEEYDPEYKDKYERFPFYLSRNYNIFDPCVSKKLLDNGLKPVYPNQKRFAVCLTHDIDIIVPSLLNTLYFATKLLMSGQKKDSLKVFLCRSSNKINPFYNFKEIMDLEKKYDAKSSFYFLVQDKGEQDYRYDISRVKNELRTIIEEGWEVGLHGSHTSYNDLKDVKYRKKKLESILGERVVGYRNHYLRLRIPDTWNILSKAGFEYDSTLGYSECAGFRNGMCHPFIPFDLNRKEDINIFEMPLNIMDGTVFGSFINPNSMNLKIEDAWHLIRKMIDTVSESHGVLTILWHNTSMLGDGLDLYGKILAYCRDKDAWMTSGKEIIKWNKEHMRHA